MSINLTDEIEVKTKKGKLGAAKQIFLEGDMQNVEKEIQDINSRHSALNTKHESLSKTVQGIAATGGASTAINVTYNNNVSGLNAENVQDAIDELVTSLKSEFSYKGIAQPTTNPGVPNSNVPYAGGAVSNELTHIHIGDSISANTDIKALFKQVFGREKYNFVKKAVSGADIKSAFSFIKQVPLETLRKAQLITFQIGTNNYMNNGSITELPEKSFTDIPYDGVDTIDKHLATFQDTIYQTYAKCIEYIMYYNPTARISFITIPQFATSSSNDGARRKTNDIIKHICGIYNLEVIDAGNNSGVSFRNWKLYSTDGTHYSNSNGEYMWWGYVARRCKEIIQNIVLRPSIVE